MSMFKNWSAIANITDDNLRLAIALIPTDSKEAYKLQQGFPECFSSKEFSGKISMSLIKQLDNKYLEENPEDCPDYTAPVSHGILGKGGTLEVPLILFGYDSEKCDEFSTVDILPEYVSRNIEFGARIEYKGGDFIVVENNDNGWVYCVPEEAVIRDLT